MAYMLFSPALSPAVTIYEKDEFRVKLSGHLQELTSSTDDPFFNGHITDNTSRARLTFRVLTNTMVSGEASIDGAYTFGSVLSSPLFIIQKDLEPPTYYNWEHVYLDEDGRYGTVSVYRAMLTLEAELYRVVVGRQRLAYGTALFWSPIDIWNPISPLALEPEEKTGVDGVSGIWWISDKLSATALFGMADEWDEAKAAASASLQVESYTFDFMAGKHLKDYVYGADFVGYLGDAGVRSEFTYTVADKRDNFIRAVLGIDYAWPNSLYAALEFYHNGGPFEFDPADPFSALLESTGVDTINRNFGAAMISFDLDPLVKGSLAAIYDLDKGSHMLGPALAWYASDHLTVSGGAQFFEGSDESEFGPYPDLGWLRLRWDF